MIVMNPSPSRWQATHSEPRSIFSTTHLSPWSLISRAKLASPRTAALAAPGAMAGIEQARQAPDDHPRGDQAGHDDARLPGHGRLWFLAAHGAARARASATV